MKLGLTHTQIGARLVPEEPMVSTNQFLDVAHEITFSIVHHRESRFLSQLWGHRLRTSCDADDDVC
jgi:hypothetical protein